MHLSNGASVPWPSSGQGVNTDSLWEDDRNIDLEDNHSHYLHRRDLFETLRNIRAGTLDLTDSKSLKGFKSTTFQGLTSLFATADIKYPTVLHLLANKLGQHPRPKLPDRGLSEKQLEVLVALIVQHKNDPLATVNMYKKTALHLAIEEGHEKMVEWMCVAHPDINSVFSNPEHRDPCLHLALTTRLRYFDQMVQMASATTLALRDKEDGSTLLHLLVDHERCTQGQLERVKAVADRCREIENPSPDADFNNKGESPFLYHLATVQKAAKELGNTRGPGVGGFVVDDGAVRGKSGDKPPGFGESELGSVDDDGGGAQTPETADAGSLSDFRLDPQWVPGKETDSLDEAWNENDMKGPKASAAFDARPEDRGFAVSLTPEVALAGGNQRPPASPRLRAKNLLPDEETSKEIEKFLKLHYLRNRSHQECLEIFYGRDTEVQDVEVNFDLPLLPDITSKGLKDLMRKLKFENALQYVNIPKICIEPDRPVDDDATLADVNHAGAAPRADQGTGRVDLIVVFDLLRTARVDTILKVMVDDSLETPHSNDAIEKCLSDFNVEELDWKRPDLSSEVVYRAAPNVKVLHLISTGNEAVLQSWSSSEGLKKLKHLERVKITAQIGYETATRTSAYLTAFKQRFEESGPISAKLEIDESPLHSKRALKSTSPLLPVATGDQKQNPTDEWLLCMGSFAAVVHNAERSAIYKSMIHDPTHEVTVALIDDGVDGRLDYRSYGGQSFFKQHETNMTLPYYQSGSGHGTQMATLIKKICPVAKVFVVRLKDHPVEGYGVSRRIDAESAAAAIKAAVRRKVQIISMSWTIEEPSDDKAKTELDEAIAAADKANILMFCSATDQGAVQTETYPSKATKKIFKIGAARSTGEANRRVGNQLQVDYIFPGERIDLGRAGYYPDAPTEEVTGSSAATAIAAAFAALIYHCARVRWLYHRHLGNSTEGNNALQDLEYMHKNRYEAMKNLFSSSIWGGKNQDWQYLKVWCVFHGTTLGCNNKDDMVRIIAETGKKLGESAKNISPPVLN
ncbi:hypothetical protein QBC39DRAFT_182335 [Podospora conica]|nr:hypothetical protein QBC39DRAFT_182335 [Schizothecium conicum]